MTLKAVIFDLGDTLIVGNNAVPGTPEIIQKLKSQNIKIVVISNRPKTEGQGKLLSVGISIDLLVTQEDTHVKKGSPEFVDYPCRILGLSRNEVILVGHSKLDMWTASNAKIVFINVQWAPQEHEYGIKIDSPSELDDFIFNIFLKEHFWYWRLDETDAQGRKIQIRSLIDGFGAGIVGLRKKLINLLKLKIDQKINGTSLRTFLVHHILASIYLSGLYETVDFWTTYPGHKIGSGNEVMDEFLTLTSQLFRDKYLRSLITRHADAPKSAFERRAGRNPPFINQSNTVKLDDTEKERIRNKSILVIDDFTTDGNSFECARNMLYLGDAAEVICVSIGKYNQYHTIIEPHQGLHWDPFSTNMFEESDFQKRTVFGTTDQDALGTFRQSYENL